MTTRTRRHFITSALAGSALLGDLLHHLTPLSADDVKLSPERVQLHPDVEPLVRLVEETDRDKLLGVVLDKIRAGASYQELLAALMLAGVRGIKPRPVGFKFHAVLVVNSAHQASLAAKDRERWLPLLWAFDNFKGSQARNQQEGGWVMPPVDETKVPPAHQARERFVAAMDNWDVEGADAAVAGLVRTAGANEIIDLFWRYGARDFRDIGHKAIYVANAWRTLQTIGWRHAEPVLRSLAFALLEHEGSNPAQRDGDPDRPGRANLERVAKLRQHWTIGKRDPAITTTLLATLREGKPEDVSTSVVDALNQGIDPAVLWDGVFLGAGELLMRQPGIVALHSVTTANALHYAYQTAARDEMRAFALLQAATFLPLFRNALRNRGQALSDLRIDALEPVTASTTAPVAEIYADVSRDKLLAARKTLDLVTRDPAAKNDLIAAGRNLVFNKGNDSHDYKFSAAILEDVHHVSPPRRALLLAAAMFNLKGTGDSDNGLIKRARAAL